MVPFIGDVPLTNKVVSKFSLRIIPTLLVFLGSKYLENSPLSVSIPKNPIIGGTSP